MLKDYWKFRGLGNRPIFRFNHGVDHDGVPDYRDCVPYNQTRQNRKPPEPKIEEDVGNTNVFLYIFDARACEGTGEWLFMGGYDDPFLLEAYEKPELEREFGQGSVFISEEYIDVDRLNREYRRRQWQETKQHIGETASDYADRQQWQEDVDEVREGIGSNYDRAVKSWEWKEYADGPGLPLGVSIRRTPKRDVEPDIRFSGEYHPSNVPSDGISSEWVRYVDGPDFPPPLPPPRPPMEREIIPAEVYQERRVPPGAVPYSPVSWEQVSIKRPLLRSPWQDGLSEQPRRYQPFFPVFVR